METEKFELMLDEAQANAALEKGMLYADTFVNKKMPTTSSSACIVLSLTFKQQVSS